MKNELKEMHKQNNELKQSQHSLNNKIKHTQAQIDRMMLAFEMLMWKFVYNQIHNINKVLYKSYSIFFKK